jgi:hypothetical protein
MPNIYDANFFSLSLSLSLSLSHYFLFWGWGGRDGGFDVLKLPKQCYFFGRVYGGIRFH